MNRLSNRRPPLTVSRAHRKQLAPFVDALLSADVEARQQAVTIFHEQLLAPVREVVLDGLIAAGLRKNNATRNVAVMALQSIGRFAVLSFQQRIVRCKDMA